MDQLIIVVSGRKQSGKNTLSNFVAGTFLVETEQISSFSITDKGFLNYEKDGVKSTVSHISKQSGFTDLKMYSFADKLKEFCMDVFGLSYDHCYGTEEQRNMLVEGCSWDKLNRDLRERYGFKSGLMTGREVMQVFGTDMVRAMCLDAWAAGTYSKIVREAKRLAIVTDGRFSNEINLGKKYGMKSIRLLRSVYKDTHQSEIALDDYEGFDLTISNGSLTIEETNKVALPYIKSWIGGK